MTQGPRPKAVIFDCDGVLVDSEPAARRLILESLNRAGLHVGPEELEEHYIGGTMAMVAERARAAGADLPDTWCTTSTRRSMPNWRTASLWLPESRRCSTGSTRPGCPTRSARTARFARWKSLLAAISELRSRFGDRVFSGQDLGKPKPDPALYLHAAEALGIAPADCAVVDDSASGCTAGVRSGARCLGYSEHDAGARLKAVGAEVFHRMADLPGLLGLD